jgi:hypothetical protein
MPASPAQIEREAAIRGLSRLRARSGFNLRQCQPFSPPIVSFFPFLDMARVFATDAPRPRAPISRQTCDRLLKRVGRNTAAAPAENWWFNRSIRGAGALTSTKDNVMATSDWRSPAAYKYLSGLTLARLAWEFYGVIPTTGAITSERMARAPSAPWRGSLATTLADAGGCDFLADPDKNADEAPVFWLPEADAATVLLAASPIEMESTF